LETGPGVLLSIAIDDGTYPTFLRMGRYLEPSSADFAQNFFTQKFPKFANGKSILTRLE
jgi:hypothetical protein